MMMVLVSSSPDEQACKTSGSTSAEPKAEPRDEAAQPSGMSTPPSIAGASIDDDLYDDIPCTD
jgi:hypothetical protein